MALESIQRLNYEPETPLLDSNAKLIRPLPKIVSRAKEALFEVGMFGLLLIVAGAISVRLWRAPLPGDIEQLREYGDWVD